MKILLSALAIAMLLACSDEEVVEPRNVYTVTYSLNIAGESSVDQVTYYFSGRNTTATHPSDGWSIQMQAGDGQTVSASATGTVKNGHILLYMRVDPDNGDPTERQDECSESAGIPTMCSLSTGGVKLE